MIAVLILLSCAIFVHARIAGVASILKQICQVSLTLFLGLLRKYRENPSCIKPLLRKYRSLFDEDFSPPATFLPPVPECGEKPHELFPITSDDCESEPNTADRLSLDGPAAVLVKKKRSYGKRDSLTDPSLTSEGEPVSFIKRRLFESMHILTIDIGATRTKFMYQFGSSSIILTAIDSRDMWICPDGTTTLQVAKLFRARLGTHLDEERRSERLPVSLCDLDSVIFSVPGTVDLTGEEEEDMCVVRNMPSLSPSLKGFNFKRGFAELFPKAKIYAVADNMAAAMGVASSIQFRNTKCGLVLVLGTAPAVATFFKAPHLDGENKRRYPLKTVELAIWQSWVWFTKIPLTDRFGYCGGLQTDDKGGFKLRAVTDYKIPHSKSRIRFAIDSLTWKRLRGRLDWISKDLQGNLTKEEARDVWSNRVQASVNSLCLKFHQVYGKPDIVVVLGGNALKCNNRISQCEYHDPDFSRSEPLTVPIYVPASDEEQQLIHMRGLAQAANYKISQVYAHGPDPLARGWTRGGEIYLWVRRRDVL